MANTRELRRRIKSVKNTSQITKAMQMVAATKMRRAQNQAFLGRPYNETLNHTLSKLIQKLEEGSHPLLKENDSKNIGMILLSTDKSLCGALNTNLFRAVLQFSPASHSGVASTTIESKKTPRSYQPLHGFQDDMVFYTIGKKGRDFVVRTGKDLIADFENTEIVTFGQAVQISKLVIKSFLAGELGEVYLAYPHFSSTLRQEPTIAKLLPVDASVTLNEINSHPRPDRGSSNTEHMDSRLRGNDKNSARDDESSEFLFEPNIDELLEYILVHSIETKIYQAMLETKASEHSARMMAMQNATDNAKELVSDLELSYNQIRQESITRELLEITSASAALE